MADPPGSHIQSHNALQAALDGHLAALQQQQQLQQVLLGGGGNGNNAIASFLAQQQHQQPMTATSNHGATSLHVGTPAATGNAPSNANPAFAFACTEHHLLRALQQRGAAAHAPPSTSDPPAATPAQSSSLENAIHSVLRASSTAEMAMAARNRLDEIAVLQAFTSQGGLPPQFQPMHQAPALPQDAFAQLFSNPAGLAESLQTLRMRANLLNGLAGVGAAPPPAMMDNNPFASLAAAARPSEIVSSVETAPTITTAAAAAVAQPKREEEVPEEDEEIPLPELPKVRPLPPLEEGDTPHWSERFCVPLATEEDSNWLSERQCFIRAELLEVVRASHQDVLVRSSSKSVAYQQVGIRCRYCAHMHPSARAIRSSAYPSSIRQMYQSFTMMVRDHWSGCTALPPKLKKRFMDYQEHKIPSSSLSREYWAYAANKIGMINTEYGITITEESLKDAERLPSFGTTPEHIKAMEAKDRETESLVHPSDQAAISPYLYLLMQQVEVCHLLESERVGKRKEATVGLSGFGCSHCIKVGRLGFCRVFPLNKRSLPTKVNDLYTHIQRCPLTPAETRKQLRKLKHQLALKAPAGKAVKFAERDREFVDQIWTKLGRKGAQIGG